MMPDPIEIHDHWVAARMWRLNTQPHVGPREVTQPVASSESVLLPKEAGRGGPTLPDSDLFTLDREELER